MLEAGFRSYSLHCDWIERRTTHQGRSLQKVVLRAPLALGSGQRPALADFGAGARGSSCAPSGAGEHRSLDQHRGSKDPS